MIEKISFDFDTSDLTAVAAVCTTEPVPPEALPMNAIMVYGAPINGFDWAYRNHGDSFYVFYVQKDGTDVEFTWEPDPGELRDAIPDPDNPSANIVFALSLLDADQ